MPKANRTCYCCGREYYYCPSCSGERKDPRVYTMWDSETCRDIFNTLVSESTKKITTLECKKKLIELGINENTVLKDSVRRHVDRVMACEEEVIEEIREVKEIKNDVAKESSVALKEIIQLEEKSEDVTTSVSTVEIVQVETEVGLKSKLEEKTKAEVIEVKKVEFDKNIENINKAKRARKSHVKNKENSEVD